MEKVVTHSTEDKSYWCEKGASDELVFVTKIAPTLNLHAEINPQKIHLKDGKYMPDLFVNGVMSDLKHVTTPFYTASRYGFDPNNTITLNMKDVERYSQKYPYINIYFWVDWGESDDHGQKVQAVSGVWKITIPKIMHYINHNKLPIHAYKNRVDDTSGNAKSSYLISTEMLVCVGVFQSDN